MSEYICCPRCSGNGKVTKTKKVPIYADAHTFQQQLSTFADFVETQKAFIGYEIASWEEECGLCHGEKIVPESMMSIRIDGNYTLE